MSTLKMPRVTPTHRRRDLSVVGLGRTHRGKVRASNEDQFIVAEIRSSLVVIGASVGTSPPRELVAGTLLAVADGMGGHPGGKQASALAVNALSESLDASLGRLVPRPEPREVGEALRLGFERAEVSLAQASRERPEYQGMGTTMTAAFATGDMLFVAHAGDSRAYLLRGESLSALTRDHTVARELADAGIEPKVAQNARFGHLVTKAVGGRTGPVEPDFSSVELREGDRLLLCTDGLTRLVPSEDILRMLVKSGDADAAVDRLLAEALARGGTDNVTLIVADVMSSSTTSARRDH